MAVVFRFLGIRETQARATIGRAASMRFDSLGLVPPAAVAVELGNREVLADR